MMYLMKIIDFNPRSRVGNDAFVNGTNALLVISIHVPAWGTTLRVFRTSHANPISIHVPAWGTTKFDILQIRLAKDFNPRSRVGNDFHWLQLTFYQFQFQSTFPRGERHQSLCRLWLSVTISIHVPAWGTTFNSMDYKNFPYISIHVPAWGTTQSSSL